MLLDQGSERDDRPRLPLPKRVPRCGYVVEPFISPDVLRPLIKKG